MCFKSARIEARTFGGKEFIRLRDQNRDLWSKELIAEGNRFLALAFKEDNQSEYHFHTAVESQYIIAKSFEKTNWQGLLNIYNYWRKITQNPSLELNRIVVVMHALGPEKALEELDKNCSGHDGHLFFAIKGEILQNLGKYVDAIHCFEKAKDLSNNKMEQKHFENKMMQLK